MSLPSGEFSYLTRSIVSGGMTLFSQALVSRLAMPLAEMHSTVLSDKPAAIHLVAVVGTAVGNRIDCYTTAV